MKNIQSEQTRKALQSKQRDLKRKGMGNKPNASAALSEEDIQVLFEKDLIRPIYTARLCRMRQAYDRPTTWLKSRKRVVGLIYTKQLVS